MSVYTLENVDIEEHEIFKNFPYKEFSLTFEKKVDHADQMVDFITFVYQEKHNQENNMLLVFDICKFSVIETLQLSLPEKQKKYLFEDTNGYNKFILCRGPKIEENNIE